MIKKLIRWYKGEVWVKLKFKGWVQYEWNTTEEDGYLIPPNIGNSNNTKSMFHKSFNGIISIEDYSKTNEPIDV